MKKNILQILLTTIMALLSFNLINAQTTNEFRTIAMKPIPGQPKHVQLFKITEEISKFKNATIKNKKEWDNLAKQLNDIIRARLKEEEKIKKDPAIQKFEKFKKTLFSEKKKLKQAINKIVKGNPEIKKLKSKVAELQKQYSKLFKEYWAIRKKQMQKIDFEKTFKLGTKLDKLFKIMTK